MSSSWNLPTNAIDVHTKNSIWTTIFVFGALLTLITIYNYWRSDLFEKKENYVGNVGGQRTYDVLSSAQSEKKQLGCYSDVDCPDETKCSDKGICTPIIHNLPPSKHMMKMGRGRENEKPSG